MFGVGVNVWGVIIAINLKKLHMKIAEGTFRALWETLWASHTISAWLTQNPVTSAALTKRKRSRVRILLPPLLLFAHSKIRFPPWFYSVFIQKKMSEPSFDRVHCAACLLVGAQECVGSWRYDWPMLWEFRPVFCCRGHFIYISLQCDRTETQNPSLMCICQLEVF